MEAVILWWKTALLGWKDQLQFDWRPGCVTYIKKHITSKRAHTCSKSTRKKSKQCKMIKTNTFTIVFCVLVHWLEHKNLKSLVSWLTLEYFCQFSKTFSIIKSLVSWLLLRLVFTKFKSNNKYPELICDVKNNCIDSWKF